MKLDQHDSSRISTDEMQWGLELIIWRIKIHLSLFDIEAIALFRGGYQTLIVVIMKYCFEGEAENQSRLTAKC